MNGTEAFALNNGVATTSNGVVGVILYSKQNNEYKAVWMMDRSSEEHQCVCGVSLIRPTGLTV